MQFSTINPEEPKLPPFHPCPQNTFTMLGIHLQAEALMWLGLILEISHSVRSQPKRIGNIAEFISPVIPASGTDASHAL